MVTFLGISELKEIALILSEETGYPISEISPSFLKRRLSSFFEKSNIRRIEQFYEKSKNQQFIDNLIYQLIVDTTELFRDPGFWRHLNNKILPEVLKNKGAIWFPDVASGEELFSLLILCSNIDPFFSNKIYFNSPSHSRISEIKSGILRCRDHALNDNNFKRLELQAKFDSYIDESQNRLKNENNRLLKNIISVNDWFLSPPSGITISLIIFRNSMLYASRILQERITNTLYNSLTPGGVLAIGVKENLPDNYLDKFEIVDQQEKIFRRKYFK